VIFHETYCLERHYWWLNGVRTSSKTTAVSDIESVTVDCALATWIITVPYMEIR
jgi:hypothetical protein